MEIIRPRMEDTTGDLKERVEEIAEQKGWKIRRTWAKLVERGIQATEPGTPPQEAD